MPWDIASGLVIVISRFLPIIAPIAMAASLGGEEDGAVRARNPARRHRHLRRPAVRRPSSSSAPCCSCPWRRWPRSPSTSGRSRSAAERAAARLSESMRRTYTWKQFVSHSRHRRSTPRRASRGRRAAPGAQACLAPELVRAALKQSFVMLRPDIQWTNPVMFVVEVGALLTLLFVVQALVVGSASQVPVTYFIALDVWLFLTVLFANFATALAEARGKAQAESLRRTRRDTPAYRLRANDTIEEVSSMRAEAGRSRGGRGRPDHPRRRRDHRGHRLGRRVGDHRRVGAGHPRSRRRPLRRHRRHAGAVGSHRGADHGRRRRVVPRPHDRPGRRRHPPAHARTRSR